MYDPRYKITDKLLNNIVALETDKTIVSLNDSSSVKTSLEKKSKVMNLFHLAHMLDLGLTIKEAEKIADGRRLSIDDERGKIINNFRNVLEFNRSSVAESYVDLDANIILHLNKILLNNWRETWEVKFRNSNEPLNIDFDNWSQFRDASIEDRDIQSKLLELLEWYRSSNSAVHNLVRIGVLLFRFWQIYPLVNMNKLTGIALADYLLTKSGYSTSSHLSIVRTFDLFQDEFVDLWTKSGTGSLTEWLERFIKAISVDISDIKDDYHKLLSDQEKSQKQPFLDLNKRQLKILRYLQTIPTVKREDYCQMMDVSTMTAFRDLNDLVDKKLLRIDGRGRGTKYLLYNR